MKSLNVEKQAESLNMWATLSSSTLLDGVLLCVKFWQVFPPEPEVLDISVVYAYKKHHRRDMSSERRRDMLTEDWKPINVKSSSSRCVSHELNRLWFNNWIFLSLNSLSPHRMPKISELSHSHAFYTRALLPSPTHMMSVCESVCWRLTRQR